VVFLVFVFQWFYTYPIRCWVSDAYPKKHFDIASQFCFHFKPTHPISLLVFDIASQSQFKRRLGLSHCWAYPTAGLIPLLGLFDLFNGI
jgi:hypothetical protein